MSNEEKQSTELVYDRRLGKWVDPTQVSQPVSSSDVPLMSDASPVYDRYTGQWVDPTKVSQPIFSTDVPPTEQKPQFDEKADWSGIMATPTVDTSPRVLTAPMTEGEIKASETLTPHAKKVLLEGIQKGTIIPAVKQPKGLAQSFWWGLTPWKEETGETVSTYGIAKGMLVMAGEIAVPGVYTARHWSEMGTGGRAMSLGMDALFFLPVVGAAGRGARAATVATRAAKTARIGSAAKAAGRETVRQVLFPVELAKAVGGIAKPVRVGEETLTGFRAATQNTRNVIQATGGKIKASLSSIETLVVPTKLPESVVTDAYHTIKVPLSKVESAGEALRARTEIIKAASKSGNRIAVETGDSIITIKRNPLMRKLGGGIAHATPQGDMFVEGLVVEWKKGMPLREQGLYMSPEPLTRFAETSAFGVKGQKSAIIIVSPEFAKKATTSSKIYKGTVEMEAIYPVGTKIPKPKQILYTRLGDTGTKVELQLGKRLTKRQILELKAEGLIEQVKNIYQPSIKISPKAGKGLTQEEIRKLANIIDDSEPRLARNLRTVAVDPNGMLRVLQRMQRPTVYRAVSVRSSNGAVVQSVLRKAERTKGESDRAYVERVSRETEEGRVPDREREAIGRDAEKARTDIERARTERNGKERETGTVRDTWRDREERGRERTVGRVEGKRGIVPPPPPAKSVEQLTPQERKGAIAWRQGQLHGKDIYIVLYPPYGDQNKIYVHGEVPFGIRQVSGIGSAFKSAEIVQGTLREPINIKMGAFRVRVSKSKKGKIGKKLVFTRIEHTASGL